MIKPVKKYSLKEKRKIAQLVISGRESVLSASNKFGIGGSMTIYRWIKQFQEGKLHLQNSSIMSKAQHSGSKNPVSTSENAALQEEIEMLRLKLLAYETMIEVAEKELGISIKKKSSAKQSTSSEQTEETLP